MRQWFDRPGSTILAVTLAPGADRAEVETVIRDRLPADVHVFSGEESVAAVGKGMAGHGLIDRHGVDRRVRREHRAAQHPDVVGAGAAPRIRCDAGDGRVAPLRVAHGRCRGRGHRCRRRVDRSGIRCGNQYLATSALTNVLSIDVVYAASVLAIVFACAAFALTLLGAIPPAVRAARLDIVEAVGVD